MSNDDPYYTFDIVLFSGQFRYFGGEPVQVRGKVHKSEERYNLHAANRTIEPVSRLHGTRIYVHMKPFVLIPAITLMIGLYPQPRSDGSIGEVLGAHERKMKEMVIGQAQAWYHPADGLIVLWENFLHDFVRAKPLTSDHNMANLWRGFERFLYKQYLDAMKITTPYHDPLFPDEEYRAFLHSLGYEPVTKAAWGKQIERNEEVL